MNKKNIMGLSLLVIGVVILILGILLGNNTKKTNNNTKKENSETNTPQLEKIMKIENYDYATAPPITYDVELNNETKELKVHIFKGEGECAHESCGSSSSSDGSIILTDSEHKKILKLWDHPHELVTWLDDLILGDKEVPDTHWDMKENKSKFDLNSDGIVTYRERANYYLDLEIKNLGL